MTRLDNLISTKKEIEREYDDTKDILIESQFKLDDLTHNLHDINIEIAKEEIELQENLRKLTPDTRGDFCQLNKKIWG